MASEIASSESTKDLKHSVFQELNADQEPEITEIESLCLQCRENGITKLLITKIPFYKEVVVMSFSCSHCHWENNELQPASKIQEKGIAFNLNVQNTRHWHQRYQYLNILLEDLGRMVVKTEWACVMIPELDFEIPSKSQEGTVSTVEGVISRAHAGIATKLDYLKEKDPESAEKIKTFLEKLADLITGKVPFTFVLRDCTGNSFLENIYAPEPDPQLEITHFERSREENLMLGMYSLDVEDEENKEDEQSEEQSEVTDEVLGLPTNCYACNAPCITNMKLTPHFKDVLIMATTCDACGYNTNEVKSGSGIEPLGVKYTLHIETPEDLKRDILKSDTCSINITSLQMEAGSNTIGSRYTTVEGLLTAIKEQLKESNPFFAGDSTDALMKENMNNFFKKLDEVASGERKATLVLDDPCGNSYVQSKCYPNPDANLIVDKYERSVEQNEELGLLDMKVENYEEPNHVEPSEES